MNSEKVTVGRRLKQFRQALNLTQKQLANEVGLEIFEQDINEKGPIFDMFKGSQELQGVLLADNVASDIRRQIDRGGLKASEAGEIMMFFDENLDKNQVEQPKVRLGGNQGQYSNYRSFTEVSSSQKSEISNDKDAPKMINKSTEVDYSE